jgi:hypothetical protein
MMDRIGKIFIAQGSHSKCAVCDLLMKWGSKSSAFH